MTATSLDYYMKKLNQLPVNVTKTLNTIKKLDRQVLKLKIEIDTERDHALIFAHQYQNTKSNKLKSDLQNKLKKIKQIHKQMLRLTNEKVELTDSLYNSIDEPTELLEKEVSKHYENEIDNEQLASKSRRRFKKDEYECSNLDDFVSSEPNYCYCRRPSFGLMVKCDDKNCEIEWFHEDCIKDSQESLSEKWYCKTCLKLKKSRVK